MAFSTISLSCAAAFGWYFLAACRLMRAQLLRPLSSQQQLSVWLLLLLLQRLPQWRAALRRCPRAGRRLLTPRTTTPTGTMSALASAAGCGPSLQLRPARLQTPPPPSSRQVSFDPPTCVSVSKKEDYSLIDGASIVCMGRR